MSCDISMPPDAAAVAAFRLLPGPHMKCIRQCRRVVAS
jgi:hypothetical protein